MRALNSFPPSLLQLRTSVASVSRGRGLWSALVASAVLGLSSCNGHIPRLEPEGSSAEEDKAQVTSGTPGVNSKPNKAGVNQGKGDKPKNGMPKSILCGNGVLDPGEECDDGNENDLDFCLSICKINRCGDGKVQSDREECDDQNDNPEDKCLNSCKWNVCGDGILHRGVEECDDGNLIDTDSCRKNCKINVCGDGVPGGIGESCDDGNNINTDGCSNTCQTATCGNGVTDPGEECDDGNLSNKDACLNSCRHARCGDSVTWEGKEQCDDGNKNENDGCSSTCKNTYCGDGVLRLGFEECDDGNTNDNDGCVGKCKIAYCGDGFHKLNDPNKEECDDGNQIKEDLCLPGCIKNVCGDGIMGGPGEQCDDGNKNDGDDCSSDCKSTKCGNGKLDPGEQCDDGNKNDNDGCLSTCRKASCGDGFVQKGVEDCDPSAKKVATCSDVMDSTFTKIHNPKQKVSCTQKCTFDTRACAACGDGTLQSRYERCDQDFSCIAQAWMVVSQGYYPDPAADATCASDCKRIDLSSCGRCGDGVHQANFEGCDDGNFSDFDDCNSQCHPTFCGDGIVNRDSKRKEVCDTADGETETKSGTCELCKGFFKPKSPKQRAEVLRCASGCAKYVVDENLCKAACAPAMDEMPGDNDSSTQAMDSSSAGGASSTGAMPKSGDKADDDDDNGANDADGD